MQGCHLPGVVYMSWRTPSRRPARGAEVVTRILRDPKGVEVLLTDERWFHILDGHPEMADHLNDLVETIQNPHVVYEKEGQRYYFLSVDSERFGRVFLQARVVKGKSHFIVPEGATPIWFTLREP
jgi:hypothetical protein